MLVLHRATLKLSRPEDLLTFMSQLDMVMEGSFLIFELIYK